MRESQIWALNSGLRGGERGIRTLGTLARSTVFETVLFNHSSTSPWGGEIACVGNACKPRISCMSGFDMRRLIVFIRAFMSGAMRVRTQGL